MKLSPDTQGATGFMVGLLVGGFGVASAVIFGDEQVVSAAVLGALSGGIAVFACTRTRDSVVREVRDLMRGEINDIKGVVERTSDLLYDVQESLDQDPATRAALAILDDPLTPEEEKELDEMMLKDLEDNL